MLNVMRRSISGAFLYSVVFFHNGITNQRKMEEIKMSWIGGEFILNDVKKKDLDAAADRIRYVVRR